MKIHVYERENFIAEICIQNYEFFALVKDIKAKLNASNPEKCLENNFQLIHNKLILNDDEYIRRYKLCENDIIYYGTVENYLKNDDAIIEVFLMGLASGIIWLILPMNDKISTVRSILERIAPEIIKIWNGNGRKLSNNKTVKDIDENGYYRLVVSCGEKKRDLTFTDCCYRYDQFRIEYLHMFLNYNSNKKFKNVVEMTEIRKRLTSNEALNNNYIKKLSNFPPSFINSCFLFCYNIYPRIIHLFNEYWLSFKYPIGFQICEIIHNCCGVFIWDELFEYVRARRDHREIADKSIKEIMIKALDQCIESVNEVMNINAYLIKLCRPPFLLNSRSNSDICESSENCSTVPTAFIIMQGRMHFMAMTCNSLTIGEVKKIIANRCDTEEEDLYCMYIHNDKKPKNEDPFDMKLPVFFELMRKMESFELVKVLGKGSFGTVKLYNDKIFEQQVVIKKQNDKNCDLRRDIFINSIKGGLGNLVKYLGTVKEGDSIHLVMEYLQGGSLTSRIRKICKQGKEKEIIDIAYQILKQIKELHQLGIVHRDIKPDNIVFDGKGIPKIIDFGLARNTGELTMTGEIATLKTFDLGASCYLAPEVIKKKPYTNKIDIWSFGMVLVEMVTGKLPFYWLGEGAIRNELESLQKYDFLSIVQISDEFKQFINSCLAVDPDMRRNSLKLIKSLFLIGYMSKGSLIYLIQQDKCLQEREIVKILYQILTQINEFHKSQRIYYKIKTANIGIDGEGNAKLVDVDLFVFEFHKFMNFEITIEPNRYMAPEYVKGNPRTNKIDIWSLGMVLVEMVTRKPPFHSMGTFQIEERLEFMENYEFEPVIPISESMKQFISLCLTVDPIKRPTGEELMGMQLMTEYRTNLR